ncbi:hypothetical protein L6164_003630 [Bauhinia variegata]|uniref:Uncharacterized protein n=1 Tax=Bauhinia variegata TaxID=167791 RepID=A0ACB9Q1Y9_BAUVA|nr:hypothetical protein L6164_003630 [Bauhinia variegata]
MIYIKKKFELAQSSLKRCCKNKDAWNFVRPLFSLPTPIEQIHQVSAKVLPYQSRPVGVCIRSEIEFKLLVNQVSGASFSVLEPSRGFVLF